jgi:hypothetical protein
VTVSFKCRSRSHGLQLFSFWFLVIPAMIWENKCFWKETFVLWRGLSAQYSLGTNLSTRDQPIDERTESIFLFLSERPAV